MNSITDYVGRRKPPAPQAEPRLPAAKNLDAEFATELKREPPPRLRTSQNMQRAKDIIGSALTAAYQDGASALQAAIDECTQKVERAKQKLEALVAEQDKLKREAAEYLLAHGNKAEELTTELDGEMQHLHALAARVEEWTAQIKGLNPSTPKLPPPAPEITHEEHHEDHE